MDQSSSKCTRKMIWLKQLWHGIQWFNYDEFIRWPFLIRLVFTQSDENLKFLSEQNFDEKFWRPIMKLSLGKWFERDIGQSWPVSLDCPFLSGINGRKLWTRKVSKSQAEPKSPITIVFTKENYVNLSEHYCPESFPLTGLNHRFRKFNKYGHKSPTKIGVRPLGSAMKMGLANHVIGQIVHQLIRQTCLVLRV